MNEFKKLNKDAREFFESLIERDFKDNKFEKELDELSNQGILFFIKSLYDFSREKDTTIIIHDSKHKLDNILDFLEYYMFKVDNRDLGKRKSDIVIELEGNHPFILIDYINRESSSLFDLITLEEDYYFLLPDKYYLPEELHDLYTNINLHYDNYSNLAVGDNKKEVFDAIMDNFIKVEIIDK